MIQVKLGEKTAFAKELWKWVNVIRKLRDLFIPHHLFILESFKGESSLTK